MISFLHGILDSRTEQTAILEVNGVGFEVYMSERDLSSLPKPGSRVKIYTYMNVREDAMQLFGFLGRGDRKMFQMLIGVSGIGPKGGLNILSVLTTDDLCYAVMGSDINALSKAPGIGKKTAERLIIELKDKLDFKNFLERGIPDGTMTGEPVSSTDDSVQSEAIQALISLGYGSTEAVKAVKNVSGNAENTVEDILKSALKELSFL